MRDFTLLLCLLPHLGPGFGNVRPSSGERLSLLVKVIPRATGMLAQETGIYWLRTPFSIGITDDGSKFSSLKVSFENGHI